MEEVLDENFLLALVPYLVSKQLDLLKALESFFIDYCSVHYTVMGNFFLDSSRVFEELPSGGLNLTRLTSQL